MAVSEDSTRQYRGFFSTFSEWLISRDGAEPFTARSGEFDFIEIQGELHIVFPSDVGLILGIVVSLIENHDSFEVLIRESDSDGGSITSIVPRIPVSGIRGQIRDSRLEIASAIGSALGGLDDPLRPIRFDFSTEAGRLVKIHCEDRWRRKVMVIADVSDSLKPEYLVSTAVLELVLQDQRKSTGRIRGIVIIGKKTIVVKVSILIGMLKEEWCQRIEILESFTTSGTHTGLRTPKQRRSHRRSIGAGKGASGLNLHVTHDPDGISEELIQMFPDAIDVIDTPIARTLRFNGLPFARFRMMSSRPRMFVGVGSRRIESSIADWKRDVIPLLETLDEYRRHDPPTRRHEYYRLMPEAWLESSIKKQITSIDPHLIVSPVYSQFQNERSRLDLLALSDEGRLVIMEIKTDSDRELPLQALSYWNNMTRACESGAVDSMQLFPNREVSSKPPLVYLVAPLLSFHADFELLAGAIDPTVEMWRVDLNEDWRRRVQVQGISRIGASNLFNGHEPGRFSR